MLELKVPFLPQPKIEHAAAELLRKYCKWKGTELEMPVDIDEIIEGYFGLTLEFTKLEDLLGLPDVLGATWFDDKQVRIDSSLEDNEGRLAFTMAHEGGHWWLHRPLVEMQKVTAPLFALERDKPATPAVVCRQSQKRAPAEWQADQFAACLLMPRAQVQATIRSMYGDSLPAWAGALAKRTAGDYDPRLRDLAADVIREGNFNVSKEAMGIRLLDLKLVRDTSDPQQTLL